MDRPDTVPPLDRTYRDAHYSFSVRMPSSWRVDVEIAGSIVSRADARLAPGWP